METNYNIFSLNIKRIDGFLTEDECKKIHQFLHLTIYPKMQTEHVVMSGNSRITVDRVQNALDLIDEGLNLNLKVRMQEALNVYSKENNIADSVIDKSWVLLQNKDSILHHHTHLNPEGIGMVSGALWVHVPEGSSKLEFVHPLEKHLDITKVKPKMLHEPQVGSFMLFPSYVLHGGDSWNHTSQRLVLSFSSHIIKE